MSHTPAPWEVDPPFTNVKTGREIYQISYKDTVVAEVDGFVGIEGDGEKNAKLIASAPELLEALKQLVKLKDNINNHSLGSLQQWVILLGNEAEKVIAKAEGT